MKPSLRSSLVWNMTALFGGTFLVLGLLAFISARTTLSGLADQFINQASRSIVDKVSNLLTQAESSGKFLSGLVAPVASSSPTITNAAAFDSIASKMIALMTANPQYGSVSYTLDRTGEVLRVAQMSGGSLVVQTTELGSGNQRIRRERVPFGDSYRTIHEDLNYQGDQRKADWYIQTKERAQRTWTSVYLFHNSVNTSTPGVTFAQPVFDRKNQFLGVVTIDFTIADLSRFIDRIQVGTNGYAVLFEQDANGQLSVIAHPHRNLLVISENGKDRLANLEELGDPVLTGLRSQLDDLKFVTAENKPIRKLVNSRGRSFATGTIRLVGENRPKWFLVLAIPDDEFMGSVWKTGFILGLIGIGALVMVIGISNILARRFSEPLQFLADETERVKSLDLAPRKFVATNVREIDDLASGMEQMKTGLRSLEKLVPADYARWLIASGQEAKLGGERKNITTYFADIIGFTALSEKMEPEELVDVLAEYLDVLSGEVLRHGGTVDKFNGDDVMAFWGAPNPAPNHAYLACESAIASQETIHHLHTEWREQSRPLLRASFGISTGDVVVGNVGSRQRMNYTVIGDAVNLASRLQGLNKFYSTEILISHQTVLGAGDAIVYRLIDWVSVAGRDQAVPAYELIALSSAATELDREIASLHNRAMEFYRDRQFQAAEVLFHRIIDLKSHDGPARILLARSQHYLADPPGPNWDGAVHLQVK